MPLRGAASCEFSLALHGSRIIDKRWKIRIAACSSTRTSGPAHQTLCRNPHERRALSGAAEPSSVQPLTQPRPQTANPSARNADTASARLRPDLLHQEQPEVLHTRDREWRPAWRLQHERLNGRRRDRRRGDHHGRHAREHVRGRVREREGVGDVEEPFGPAERSEGQREWG